MNGQRKGKSGKLGGFFKIVVALVILLYIVAFVISAKSNKKPEQEASFELGEYTNQEYEINLDDHKQISFYAYPSKLDEEDIELVNSDEEVAKCLIQKVHLVNGKNVVTVSIVPLNCGEISLYLQTKDGTAKSEEVKISISEQETEADNSRTVYLNYEGKKYHYSSSCAGKSCYASTLNQAVKLGKKPCSKCVR